MVILTKLRLVKMWMCHHRCVLVWEDWQFSSWGRSLREPTKGGTGRKKTGGKPRKASQQKCQRLRAKWKEKIRNGLPWIFIDNCKNYRHWGIIWLIIIWSSSKAHDKMKRGHDEGWQIISFLFSSRGLVYCFIVRAKLHDVCTSVRSLNLSAQVSAKYPIKKYTGNYFGYLPLCSCRYRNWVCWLSQKWCPGGYSL